MQAIQVLICALSPCIALFTQSLSAKNGLAIDTISACPSIKICSAISGILIRLVATKGIFTSPLIFSVTQENAARGTIVAIVGIRDSCHPIPVLIIVAPAFSISFAKATTSSQLLPPSTKSNMDNLYIIIKCRPTFSRHALTISTGNFIRFSKLPPHSSFLWFVLGAIN